MTFGIFEEIERLIEYIPIENGNDFTSFGGGRLADGVTIDSQYYFKDVDGVATTREKYCMYKRYSQAFEQIS